MSGSIRIEDNDAGENRAQINNYALQNLTDEPPVPESATVNAETVTVTFDQALDPDSVPRASAFSLTPDGPSVILASIQGAVLTLTLAESVVEDVTYTLSYTPTEGGKLLDKTGNAAEAFELLEMFETLPTMHRFRSRSRQMISVASSRSNSTRGWIPRTRSTPRGFRWSRLTP